jgi:predicted exporter
VKDIALSPADGTSVQAVSAFVPSIARQSENRRRLEASLLASPDWLRDTLDAQGFREDRVAALVARVGVAASDAYLEPGEWLQSPLSVPFRHLWMGQTARGHASLVLPGGFASLADLRKAETGLDGVTLVDKAGSVSELFKRYWKLAFLGMLVAIGVVYVVLCVRYGWRGGFVVLLPTLLAISVALAFCGYAGVPFTLFNIMALMLVLGVGVNYALFMHEGGERAASALVGIVLSGLATLLSFGLLALSSTPALQRFGVTLVIGIAVAMLLAPGVLLHKEPHRQ